MVEIRCKGCRRLLCKLDAEKGGRVEVVCPDKHCRRYQVHALQSASR
jgi:phage FluMu protein Com